MAHLNHIASDKRVAFQARLKHLQRLNFPEGTNTGKGKPARYTFANLMQLVIAVELLQTGFPPQMAVKLVEGSWSMLRHTIYLATHTDEEWSEWQEMPLGPETRDWLWVLSPEALRDLSAEGVGEYDHMEAITPVSMEAVARLLETGGQSINGENWRTLVLHGTRITQAVISVMDEFGYATRREMREDITDDLRALNALLEDLPFHGVEESAQTRLELARQQVSDALASSSRQLRYFPSQSVLERQAAKAVERLPKHQLAYLAHEELAGRKLGDVKALTALLIGGYLLPTGPSDFELSPLGRAVQRLCLDIPRDLIIDWREKADEDATNIVKKRITALLATKPDHPKDDPDLERWARHGGEAPTAEKRHKEVGIARSSTVQRKARGGDDQEA